MVVKTMQFSRGLFGRGNNHSMNLMIYFRKKFEENKFLNGRECPKTSAPLTPESFSWPKICFKRIRVDCATDILQ